MDLELTSERRAFEVDAIGVMDYAVENGVPMVRPPITSGEFGKRPTLERSVLIPPLVLTCARKAIARRPGPVGSRIVPMFVPIFGSDIAAMWRLSH